MSQRKWELLSLVTTLNKWLNERESYIQNLFTKFYLTCIIIHTTNVFVIMTNMVLSLWKSVSIIKIGVLLFRHSVMFNFLWPQWLRNARLPSPSLSPGFAQIHVHWVDDAIQPSYLLLPSSPPALTLPQDQGIVQWISSSHQVAKVLELQQSASVLPMNINGLFPLGLTGLISLLFKGLSRVFSNTTFWKHQFFGTLPSLWSNSHIHTWLLENP